MGNPGFPGNQATPTRPAPAACNPNQEAAMNDLGLANGVETSLAAKGAEAVKEIGVLVARAAESLAGEFECSSGSGQEPWGPAKTNSPSDTVLPGQG
jgi:hypothetical protein